MLGMRIENKVAFNETNVLALTDIAAHRLISTVQYSHDMVASSMGLCLSGNREINMTMMMKCVV